MKRLKTEKPNAFCNQRSDEYLGLRQYYEKILRDEFAKKGGIIEVHIWSDDVIKKYTNPLLTGLPTKESQ